MRSIIPGAKVHVQSEMVGSTFYTVTFGKTRKEDRCSCLGVEQYLGTAKDGHARYRRKYNCFHVEWAREYWKPGMEFLTCGQDF